VSDQVVERPPNGDREEERAERVALPNTLRRLEDVDNSISSGNGELGRSSVDPAAGPIKRRSGVAKSGSELPPVDGIEGVREVERHQMGVGLGKVVRKRPLDSPDHGLNSALGANSELGREEHVRLEVVAEQDLGHQSEQELADGDRPDPTTGLDERRESGGAEQLVARSGALGDKSGQHRDKGDDGRPAEGDRQEGLGLGLLQHRIV